MQPTATLRMFKPTRRMLDQPVSGDVPAHTISQRLRTLKKIPPELIPIGFVVGVALSFAGYSVVRKFVVDKQMRLTRQNRKD
ncbi:hypothetical protein QTJ16_004912 [Diplocarpon rosae]|uniref:NADH-ubiquinone reductase complex 1 MLRQ subunit n=1 Tax=Diplocarpon rosae TaxID=946125 RepID=A0AAD9SXR1_9HELO|nr:hypothetical protein QTJ16_004912 [Diplocarpon rosae]